MGTWPFATTNKERYLLISLSIFFDLATLFSVWGCVNQVFHYVNILIFTESAIIAGTGIVPAIKNNIFLIKNRKLQEMIISVNDLYENTPIKSSEVLTKNSEEMKKYCNKFVKRFLYTLGVLWVLMHTAPMLKYLQTGIKILPEPAKFPFSYNSLRIYLIIYFIHAMHGLRIIFTAGEDALMFALSSFLCTRIEALVEFLEVSIERASTSHDSAELFKKCVNYQRKIYR